MLDRELLANPAHAALKRNVPWDATFDGVINQLHAQHSVVLKLALSTNLTLLKPAPFNRIMRSRGTYIVRDEVIMRDDVPLIGMIPEPPDVLNQLAVMIPQRVVVTNP